MVHIPEWESLADALKRVMATGVTESEAQIALCDAIANRKITIRLFIGNFERADFFLLEQWIGPPHLGPIDLARRPERFGLPPQQVGLTIPVQITPQDFDWRESRPLKPWRDTQHTFGFLDWQHDRIELFAAEVAQVISNGHTNDERHPKLKGAAAESGAIKALASHLKRNPDLKRKEAAAWCKMQGFALSGRSFQNRVWPSARVKAGFDPKASPGRKRK
jgi:hypothetical protein